MSIITKDNPPKTALQDTAERAWKAYQRSGAHQCDSVVCTSSAEWLKKKYFKSAKIVGYFSEDNPSAVAGKDEGGHDFLLVDGRYIVDFWYKDLYEPSADLILDAENSTDRVRTLYGDARKWCVV